jgi:uncharacterized protein (TIGR00106 family)
MAIAEVSIFPLGTESPSISRYVARALRVLQQEKGIDYELTAMGTIIQGDLESILSAVKNMHLATFDEGAPRVVTTLEIDDRRDKPLSMRGKIESVEKKLGL